MLQIIFALLAGILTVGAPCILPLLPILLGASVGQQSKSRPLYITLGFVITFSVVGLSLSFLITQFGLSPTLLRNSAVTGLGIFGIFMLWPTPFEKLTAGIGEFSTKANLIATKSGSGNFGGFILGSILGILWTPCAGPVLGAILTLIATNTNIAQAGILLTAYAIGAGIPMLLIAYGGQYITTRVRVFAHYTGLVQKIFGILILLLAFAMFFQYDLVLQARLLELFPAWNFAESSLFN